MARETVLYFEDDDGFGRVARDHKTRLEGSFPGREVVRVHDYLMVERFDSGEWVETQRLGDYVKP